MVLRYKEQLGAAIRARRRELGMSQKDLAEAAHVKEPQTVSRWERGVTLPNDLEAVANALKWTVAALHAGIQPPKRVSRKLGIEAADDKLDPSQLDRIEGMLERLLAQAELSPEDDVDRLVQEIEEESAQAGDGARPGKGQRRSEGASRAKARRSAAGRRAR